MRALLVMAVLWILAGCQRNTQPAPPTHAKPNLNRVTATTRVQTPRERYDDEVWHRAEERDRRRREVVRHLDGLTISEPTGLPSFQVYHSINGLEAIPAHSPCAWEELRGEYIRETRYVPRSFQRPRWHIVANDLARCGFPSNSSWAYLLRSSLKELSIMPIVYDHPLSSYETPEEAREEHLTILTGYGILQGNLFDDVEGDGEGWEALRRETLPRIYRSEALLERVFTWALPVVQQAWALMPTATRDDYRGVVADAQQYLATFDERAETTYLHRLESNRCNRPHTGEDSRNWFQSHARPGYPASQCTYLFTWERADGTRTPYRKVEAWIYRRIHDGMPRERLAQYLNRLTAALN